jgi:hypothetical protein
MASNPSSNQPFVVNFDNSSRDNFLSWKRSIDSTLSRHPNNLLTIVQDWELATSVRVRIKKDAKALGEEPNADYLLAFVHEFDTAAYYIIIASVSNRTVLQEMERRFGEKTEGKKAYEHICRLWELNGDDADERFTGKDQERKDLVNAGPQSGSNEHVSKFVEDLIAINNELADTDWHWSDTILTTTLLSALSKIMPHYVDGFRGQHAGKTGWKSDFDKVWKAIKTHLDTKEIEASRERGPANTEILASNSAPDPRDARIDALTEQVAILATMLTKRGRTSERPNVGKCPDCNHPHKPDDTFGCIGKAVHEKKITLADAARKFTFAKDPERLVTLAAERYKTHNNIKDTKPSGITLTKQYGLCVTTSPKTVEATLFSDVHPEAVQNAKPGHLDSDDATTRVVVEESDPKGEENMNLESQRVTRETTGIGAPATTHGLAPTPEPKGEWATAVGVTTSKEGEMVQTALADVLATGNGGDRDVLKFDTQAQSTILCNPRFFPNGVDATHLLELSTIVPGRGARAHTQGCGPAVVMLNDGTILSFQNAHLYEAGLHNVVATRLIEAGARIDAETHSLHMLSDGRHINFDAGYCAMHVLPVGEDRPKDLPRHPDAAAALLTYPSAVLSTFGGITQGTNSRAGTHSMSNEDLGLLFAKRTGLNTRALQSLPGKTDAPERLQKIPSDPINDEVTLRANFPKLPAKPVTGADQRTHIVCFDLEGPHPASKHGNNRYTCNFIYLNDGEDVSKRRTEWHVNYLAAKSDFPNVLANFVDTADLPWKKVQFYTDNEIVLNSKEVKQVMAGRGLKPMRNSCEWEPWTNGVAERPWRTLASAGRTFLLRGFGECDERANGYWTYAYEQAANVHKALDDPDQKGHIKHLRVPFCLAYAKTPNYYRSGKLSAQAEKCMHLGWSRQKPGYVLEVLEGPRKGKVITSSMVKFREDVFPLHCESRKSKTESTALIWDDIAHGDDDDDTTVDAPGGSDGDSDDDGDDGDAMPGLDEPPSEDEEDPPSDDEDPPSDDEDDDDDMPDLVPGHRYPTRSTTDLGDWRPIARGLDEAIAKGSAMLSTGTKSAPNRFHDISKIEDVEKRNRWYRAHYAENDGLLEEPAGDPVLNVIEKPASISEKDLLHLNTLYAIKSDGRYKARTVLGAGKRKLDSMDLGYERTYSPTARPATLRLLSAIAAIEKMIIRGGDVKQAYGQAKWPSHLKKVLSRVPSGYKMYDRGKTYCCEVGNLYGHVIAGKNWWKTLRAWLLAHGFTQSEWDPCLFTTTNDKGEMLFVLTYVDDLLFFETDGADLYSSFEKAFSADFKWTPFGTDLHDFVSIRITQKPGEVSLDMSGYITRCIEEAFPGGVHHAYALPADTDLPQVVAKAAAARDTTWANTDVGKRFRSLVMKANYSATQCRPDISATVGYLSRVMAYPSPDLLKRAERLMIYLDGTKDLKLTYSSAADHNLKGAWAPRVEVEGHADANWETAHSTSAYVFILLAAISWSTKKQESIALNTQQAEIVAGSLAACEAVFLRGILTDIGHSPSGPTTILMDNTSAIDLSYDPVLHSKTKHIERRDLFIRELVSRQVVATKYIATSQNVADALTKPLMRDAFFRHRAVAMGS